MCSTESSGSLHKQFLTKLIYKDKTVSRKTKNTYWTYSSIVQVLPNVHKDTVYTDQNVEDVCEIPGGSTGEEDDPFKLAVVEEIIEWPDAALLTIGIWRQIWVVAAWCNIIITLQTTADYIRDPEQWTHSAITNNSDKLTAHHSPTTVQLYSVSVLNILSHCLTYIYHMSQKPSQRWKLICSQLPTNHLGALPWSWLQSFSISGFTSSILDSLCTCSDHLTYRYHFYWYQICHNNCNAASSFQSPWIGTRRALLSQLRSQSCALMTALRVCNQFSVEGNPFKWEIVADELAVRIAAMQVNYSEWDSKAIRSIICISFTALTLVASGGLQNILVLLCWWRRFD